MMRAEKASKVMSIIFAFVVFAQALRWNAAGKPKATGVQKTDPLRASSALIYSFCQSVKPTVSPTSMERVKFFDHWRFLVFGQPR